MPVRVSIEQTGRFRTVRGANAVVACAAFASAAMWRITGNAVTGRGGHPHFCRALQYWCATQKWESRIPYESQRSQHWSYRRSSAFIGGQYSVLMFALNRSKSISGRR